MSFPPLSGLYLSLLLLFFLEQPLFFFYSTYPFIYVFESLFLMLFFFHRSLDVQESQGEQNEEGGEGVNEEERKKNKGSHIANMYASLFQKKKARRWLPIKVILEAHEASFSEGLYFFFVFLCFFFFLVFLVLDFLVGLLIFFFSETVLEIVTENNSYYLQFDTIEDLDRFFFFFF